MARNLDRVLDRQPGVLGAGHRALDEDQAAFVIDAHDFEILLGAFLVTHVTGHLLVLEDAARILALASRTQGTVADRNAVGGAHAAETPALHAARKALALRVPGNIDQLARHKVRGSNRRADFEHGIISHTEFADAGLERHLRLGEMFALRLGYILLFRRARAELESDITVALCGADRDDLTLFQRQDGNGHMPAVLLKQAGHSHFPGDHAGAHDPYSIQRPDGTIPKGVFNPKYERAPSGLSAFPSRNGGGKRDGGRLPGQSARRLVPEVSLCPWRLPSKNLSVPPRRRGPQAGITGLEFLRPPPARGLRSPTRA